MRLALRYHHYPRKMETTDMVVHLQFPKIPRLILLKEAAVFDTKLLPRFHHNRQDKIVEETLPTHLSAP